MIEDLLPGRGNNGPQDRRRDEKFEPKNNGIREFISYGILYETAFTEIKKQDLPPPNIIRAAPATSRTPAKMVNIVRNPKNSFYGEESWNLINIEFERPCRNPSAKPTFSSVDPFPDCRSGS